MTPIVLLLAAALAPGGSCAGPCALTFTPTEMKRHLRRTTPIESPRLYRTMRLGTAVLSFDLSVDTAGRVTCLQATSGHPLLISAAVEAIRRWEFRPPRVEGKPSAFCGMLLIRARMGKRGLRTDVMAAEPAR